VFDRQKIAESADLITALLGELHDNFYATKGGGWSF